MLPKRTQDTLDTAALELITTAQQEKSGLQELQPWLLHGVGSRPSPAQPSLAKSIPGQGQRIICPFTSLHLPRLVLSQLIRCTYYFVLVGPDLEIS